MAWWKRKLNPRRSKLRETLAAERLAEMERFAQSGITGSILLGLIFVAGTSLLLSVSVSYYSVEVRNAGEVLALSALSLMLAAAIAVYIYKYQNRIIRNNLRGFALIMLFLVLVAVTKLGMLVSHSQTVASIAMGVMVTEAIILTIAYDQRFAIGMSLFFAILIWLAIGELDRMDVFIMMMVGVFTCCFSLKDIRTRMKLIEVSILTAAMVFITAGLLGIIRKSPAEELLVTAGLAAFAVIVVGFVVQGILPLIERAFRVVTSMTLLDYSDASQPLLKRLAMDAPGTYSHSLLIGSLAEAAAETVGANSLLCRVGAYYHDIGKINKPGYFVENQMGAVSRHKELSPAMSQLIIIGHVKDGIEMAREYKLPSMLRQFIETHHGTTLIEYFYNEARKRQQDEKNTMPSESDFRYSGPRPKTREAAIVMLADSVEGAVRSLPEVTPTRIEAVVHNVAMKRLQDGQFDECDLTLRELSKIEASLTKSLAAHYHGRIAYPQSPDKPDGYQQQAVEKIS